MLWELLVSIAGSATSPRVEKRELCHPARHQPAERLWHYQGPTCLRSTLQQSSFPAYPNPQVSDPEAECEGVKGGLMLQNTSPEKFSGVCIWVSFHSQASSQKAESSHKSTREQLRQTPCTNWPQISVNRATSKHRYLVHKQNHFLVA